MPTDFTTFIELIDGLKNSQHNSIFYVNQLLNE